MEIVGNIPEEALQELRRKGFTPEQAYAIIDTEARKRHPGKMIIVKENRVVPGFTIYAV